MAERKTVAEIIRFELKNAEVKSVDAASWAGIAPTTFAMKLKNNTFSAEEARAILEGLGYEIQLVAEKAPLMKKLGGIGPRVQCMVNRTIYDTARSVALCHTDWSDGWRKELFQDQEGRFFVAHYTNWEGASNFISEICKSDAAFLYAKYGDGKMKDLFM